MVSTLGVSACTSPPVRTISDGESELKSQAQDRHQAEVEEHLQIAVESAEKLGPNNPLFFSSLYNLASYYRDQKEYSKAEAIYQRALSIKEETNGPDHPDVVMILDNYAQLLKTANRQEEAILLEARAKTIRTKHFHKEDASQHRN